MGFGFWRAGIKASIRLAATQFNPETTTAPGGHRRQRNRFNGSFRAT